MPFWRRIYMLGRNIVREQRVEQDLADEIHSYRQMLEDEKTRSGLDPRLARREALLELGGVAQVQEQVRDVRAGSMLQNIRAEIRQSLRSLARNPGLTATAMAMLALGMGATTVVFSVFYAALVQPLPFREPGRLVQLWETRLDRGWSRASFTEANFWDLRIGNYFPAGAAGAAAGAAASSFFAAFLDFFFSFLAFFFSLCVAGAFSSIFFSGAAGAAASSANATPRVSANAIAVNNAMIFFIMVSPPFIL